MTDDAKPAHPPPWRWVPFEGDIALVDGNGEPLVFTELIHDDVAAVTELAPEMEAKLREYEFGARGGGICAECVGEKPVHKDWCEWGALLARLDEARKSGGVPDDTCVCGAKRSEHGPDGRCFPNPEHPFHSKRFTLAKDVR